MNYRYDLLQKQRKLTGESYETIAERAGLSLSHTWDTINGNVDPSASTLKAIFSAMGFKPQDALNFEKPRIRRAVVATAR